MKSPKIYFVDTGLLCYLVGISEPDQLLRSPLRGSIFENMVVMAYKKHFSLQKSHSQFFFYRTSSGVEIDLLIQRGVNLSAYEIKFAKTLSKDMAHHLFIFQKEHKCLVAQVLSLQDEDIPLSSNVKGVHWSKNLFKKID